MSRRSVLRAGATEAPAGARGLRGQIHDRPVPKILWWSGRKYPHRRFDSRPRGHVQQQTARGVALGGNLNPVVGACAMDPGYERDPALLAGADLATVEGGEPLFTNPSSPGRPAKLTVPLQRMVTVHANMEVTTCAKTHVPKTGQVAREAPFSRVQFQYTSEQSCRSQIRRCSAGPSLLPR